jgi:hypothetical protein
MMALNIGFLAADVLGVVSFGASTAASTAAKAAIKTGVKVAAKSAAKAAAKQVGKTGLKTGVKLFAKGAGKAFKSEMKGIVKKAGKGKKPVTSKGDPPGTFRDKMGRLRNKNGTFAKDPSKQAKVKNTIKNNKAKQLRLNQKNGTKREIEVKNELLKDGHEVVGSQVSVKTKHTRRVIDHLIKDKNTKELKAIEVKSGGAKRNPSQILKDDSMAKDGGKVIGKNAPDNLRNKTIKIKTEVKH